MERDYFRYEITNGIYNTISGADTIAEARGIVKTMLEDDKAYGFNTTRNDYHIFRLNKSNGNRLTEV